MMAVNLLSNIIILVTFIVAGSLGAKDYSECDKLSVLEQALYDLGDNKERMNRFFYPPRQQPVPYVKITYQFEDENGEISNDESKCEVTYIWVSGGFLLIQPPSIFMYTSLFFYNTRQQNFFFNLRLPYQCRPLVENATIGSCSCKNRDGNPLDLLTQQIREYARYNDPKYMVIDSVTLFQAECYEELAENYYHGTNTAVYLAYILVAPLIFLSLLTVVVRSAHNTLPNKLYNSQNHANVAGIILAGILLVFFVVGMDILAVRKTYINAEFHDIPGGVNIHSTLNYFSTIITLILDLIISLIVILFLAYLCCIHSCGTNKCVKWFFPRAFSPFFYAVFGESLDQNKSWGKVFNNDEDEKKRHTAWLVSFVLLAPLFSIATHIGYICAAWLTDPAKATAVAITSIAVIFYVFFMFRQCYMTNKETIEETFKDKKLYSCCLPLYPFFQCFKHIIIVLYLCIQTKPDEPAANPDAANLDEPPPNAANLDEPNLDAANPDEPNLDAANPDEPPPNATNPDEPPPNAANPDEPPPNAANLDEPNLDAANPPPNAANPDEPPPNAANPDEPPPDADADNVAFHFIRCLPQCFLDKSEKTILSKKSYDHNINDSLSTKTLCVISPWGLLLMGTMIFMVYAFYELPIASYLLPIYLLEIFKILMVVIALLITYKILNIGNSEIRTFMRSIKKGYEDRRNERAEALEITNKDEVEATGTLTGELLEVVIHGRGVNARQPL